jgi:hypothetical protein
VRALGRWTLIYRLGRPIAPLYAGRALAIEGRPARARRLLREAIAQARALSMPWYEGMAHLELGALAPGGSAEKREHLERARALFGAIGADVQLVRTDAALAGRDTR